MQISVLFFFFFKECCILPTDSRITFLEISRVGKLKNISSSLGRSSINGDWSQNQTWLSIHYITTIRVDHSRICDLIYPKLINIHDIVQLTLLYTSCLVAAGTRLCWFLPSGFHSSAFQRFSKVNLGRWGCMKGSSLLGRNCSCRFGAVIRKTNFWNLGNVEVISIRVCVYIYIFYIHIFLYKYIYLMGGIQLLVLYLNLLFPKEGSSESQWGL